MSRSVSRPTTANRRASAARAPAAPALSPRTVADLAAVESGGGSWTYPHYRTEFIAKAEACRADPWFRMFEEIAEENCRVPRLVTIRSDQLDFHEVSAASLLAALRAAFLAGVSAGREESFVVSSHAATGEAAAAAIRALPAPGGEG